MPFQTNMFSWELLILLLLYFDRLSVCHEGVPQPEVSALFLKHFKFNHLNGMRSELFCPNKYTYVVGAKIRTSSHLNQSFPAVTALKIICSDRITPSLYPDKTLILDRNVGEWGDYKQCTHGHFVHGITFHLQSLQTFSLIADEDYEEPANSQMFNVFELGRGRYVSGITFNCSDLDDDEYHWSNQNQNPDFNSFTLGYNSGFGLRIYCTDKRVVSGIAVMKESIVSYDEGERMIPVKLLIECSLLFTPGRNCQPELSWEAIQNPSCNSSDDSTFSLESISIPEMDSDDDSRSEETNHASKHPWKKTVTCQFRSQLGTSLNTKIENLEEIKNAYNALDLIHRGSEFLPRIYTAKFKTDWKRKYNLTLEEYRSAMKIEMLLLNGDVRLNLTTLKLNVTSDLFHLSHVGHKLEGMFGMKRKIVLSQLVGFCGVFKLYFPLFKAQYRSYFEWDKDNVNAIFLVGEREVRFDSTQK